MIWVATFCCLRSSKNVAGNAQKHLFGFILIFMYEKELFANYEFDNSNWNKIILGLVGGSTIFHVIILLFLVYVPAVRDAFYVAMLFSDAPTGWISKDYNKTEIGEDTASIIDLPPETQLQYPAGYFNLANGDAPAPDLIASTTPYVPETVPTDFNSIQGFPGYTIEQPTITPTPFPIPPEFNNPIPASPNNRRSSTKIPPALRKKKNATITPFEGVNGEIPGIPQPSPTVQTEPKKEETAKAAPTPNTTNSLNSEPLRILADKAIKQINDKQIDLNKPVNVTIRGVLDDKGKLIADKTKFKNNGGDEKLAAMAVELIAAMNDSNMLTYIKALSDGSTKRDVVFNISKDEKEVKFQIVSDVGDAEKAGKIQSTLNFGMGIILTAKAGTEEGELLQGVKIETDKNQVVINWQMDTPTVLRKIQNKLDKIAAEQKTVPANSNSNSQAAIK